jgi:HEAT repeat protein
MNRSGRMLCILAILLCASPAAALFDEQELIREYTKKLSKEKDPRERASAAHWLGGRKDPAAVDALAKALSDPDASVRQAAASGLWDTGKDALAAKPELQKTLADPEAAVVARAAGALAAMDVPDAELAPAWRRALEGARDDATAFVSARGLVGIDPPLRLAPPILTYLAENAHDAAHPRAGQSNLNDRDSAEAAAKALERLLKKDAAPVLPLLDETVRKTPEAGRYVFSALGRVKTLPPGTVDLALAHTRSSDPDTRGAAIALAGKVTSEKEAARWIPEATRLLGDPEEGVRSSAIWALRGVKGLAHDAAPELARLVASERSMSIRTSAAEAIEEIGDVSNPIPKWAKAAVAAAAKGPLAAAMKDKDHDLAPAAVAAYNKLAIENGELVAALADTAVTAADSAARARALQCLRNRQGQAKVVLERIRPLAQSPDKLVADEAKVAVEWIERGGAGSPSAIGGSAEASPKAAESSAPRPPKAGEGRGEGGSEAAGLAKLRERHFEFDEPSFSRALSEADGEAVRAYLDGGMSANHVFADSNRRTPLMIVFFGRQACAKGPEGREIVSLLIQRGADVNAQDDKKNTPLMFAASDCDRETLRLLLKAGAKVDAKNWAGLTALQSGIYSGNPGLEELIAAGARLDAATAKAYAESYKSNPKALELIRKATAK